MMFKKQPKTIPVYMINGFEGCGKTDFIKFTLAQPYFKTKGTTLLIVCEEGTTGYNSDLLSKTRTVIERMRDASEFTPDHLLELEAKVKPERVVVEWNGMWNYQNMKLPFGWQLEQQITLIDGSKFQEFYTDYRQLLSDMMRASEMIIFNRCDGLEESLPSFRRNVKALNQQADVVFEDSEGEINQIFEEDLPYDLSQENIELDNRGYGMWYLDSMDNLDRYIGKTMTFVGVVYKPKNFEADYFVPGRMAMTCCANDLAFLGFACHYTKASELKDKEWVKVTAKVTKAFRTEYKGEGPVLEAISVEKTTAPKEAVISFS